MTTTKEYMEQVGLDPDEEMVIRGIALHCASIRLGGGFGVSGGSMASLVRDTVEMATAFERYLMGLDEST